MRAVLALCIISAHTAYSTDQCSETNADGLLQSRMLTDEDYADNIDDLDEDYAEDHVPPEMNVAQMSPAHALSRENCPKLLSGNCAPLASIIGTDKCGTNAIYAYLKTWGLDGMSREACRAMSNRKGWCGEINWDFGTFPLNSSDAASSYVHNFDPQQWPTVDKSTTYLRWATNLTFLQNMRLSLPSTKMIAIICDPIKRTWSRMMHYRAAQADAGEHKDMSNERCPWLWNNADQYPNTILEYTQAIVDQLASGKKRFAIKECSICPSLCVELTTGSYRSQLEAMATAYGDNFTFFLADDVLADPMSFSENLAAFLGLPRQPFKPEGQVHTFSHHPAYLPKEGKLWESFYELVQSRMQYDWQELLQIRRSSHAAEASKAASLLRAPRPTEDTFEDFDDALAKVLLGRPTVKDI